MCRWGEGDDPTRRIRGDDSGDSGLGQAIRKQDWEDFWRRVKGGTQDGASGVNVDLVKACYKESIALGKALPSKRAEHVGETMWLLTNIARTQRKSFESWLEELMYFFIKNPGTTGMENSRPVGLLEVLFKCSEASDAAAILSVWVRMGLLQDDQWAYRAGRGCEGPLVIWMLLGEESNQNKADAGEAQTDAAKAFGAPTAIPIAIFEAQMAIPE